MELIRMGPEDACKLWDMQVEAFWGLYQTYRDTETSPATETVEKVRARLKQPFTYYYCIRENGVDVGAVRVVDTRAEGVPKRISPLFVLPAYRNRGVAQRAIRAVEERHGSSGWELETILQEKGNCYLYEKMGYHLSGEQAVINEKMTLVLYKKD